MVRAQQTQTPSIAISETDGSQCADAQSATMTPLKPSHCRSQMGSISSTVQASTAPMAMPTQQQ